MKTNHIEVRASQSQYQVTAKFGVSYKHSSCVNRIISTDDLFVEKSFVYISLSIYLSIDSFQVHASQHVQIAQNHFSSFWHNICLEYVDMIVFMWVSCVVTSK